MSANYLVDLKGTAMPAGYSLIAPAGVNSYLAPASGLLVGVTVDLLHANAFTNLVCAAGNSASGTFTLAVQTSDSTASGTFVAPFSGESFLPSWFTSGMCLTFGSGGVNPVSGILDFAGFICPARYARVNLVAGNGSTDFFQGALLAGFIKQLRTTGSGGGASQSPAAGSTQAGVVVNV